MLIRSVTSVSRSVVLRRIRLLPRPGRILMRQGQRVHSTDVVGTVCAQPELITLDVDFGLGLPPHRCDDFIQHKAGDTVMAGDVIAMRRSGIFQRTLRAPTDGIVRWISNGKVVLETQESTQNVTAHYPGIVADLVPEWGVVIETQGRQIQGVWGNGKIASARLIVAVQNPDETFDRVMLNESLKGCIVVGGSCVDEEHLQKLAALSPAGLILSGMTAKLNAIADSCAFPILIMEGFGNLVYDELLWEGVTLLHGQAVVINAGDPAGGRRAFELFAFEEKHDDQCSASAAGGHNAHHTGGWTPFFYPGQRVRIIQNPFRGCLGVIEHIFDEPQKTANGLLEPAAKVRISDTRSNQSQVRDRRVEDLGTKNREDVIIPLTNLNVVD